MVDVNDRQVAGDHYQSQYQYWDFAHDIGMLYHDGCAGKYVTRCYKKNGVEDLEKALHYLEKCRALALPPAALYSRPVVVRFAQANDLTLWQRHALFHICQGAWSEAMDDIRRGIDGFKFTLDVSA